MRQVAARVVRVVLRLQGGAGGARARVRGAFPPALAPPSSRRGRSVRLARPRRLLPVLVSPWGWVELLHSRQRVTPVAGLPLAAAAATPSFAPPGWRSPTPPDLQPRHPVLLSQPGQKPDGAGRHQLPAAGRPLLGVAHAQPGRLVRPVGGRSGGAGMPCRVLALTGPLPHHSLRPTAAPTKSARAHLTTRARCPTCAALCRLRSRASAVPSRNLAA